MIRLYRQTTTIPKIRAALQIIKQTMSSLAKGYSISELTVTKRQKRNDIDIIVIFSIVFR